MAFKKLETTNAAVSLRLGFINKRSSKDSRQQEGRLASRCRFIPSTRESSDLPPLFDDNKYSEASPVDDELL